MKWAIGERKPSKRAKHIDVRIHHVRSLVANRDLSIVYTSTEDNDADFLIKPLGKTRLKVIMNRLLLKSKFEEEC